MGTSKSLRRILVVDDDAAIRLLLEYVLGLDGFETDLVESIEKAVELLDFDRQCLLITDLHLSGRSGLELILKVRAQSSNFPILLLSSDPAAFEAVEHDPKLVRLSKPFELDEFRASVRRLTSGSD